MSKVVFFSLFSLSLCFILLTQHVSVAFAQTDRGDGRSDCFIEQSTNQCMYIDFAGCDGDPFDGAHDYCWHDCAPDECGSTSPPPPPPPPDETPPGSDDPGLCTGKKNTPGSLPRVILDQNNCSPGYKPDLTFTTTGRGAEIRNINCRCIPESTPICSARGKSCTLNGDECQEGPGCETVVCVNATSTVRGICVDTSISCPRNNVMCSSDENCQSLGGMCDLFTCWAVGRSRLCRFGSQPTPRPSASPISAGGLPCDPDSPDGPGIRTAIGCVHTSPKGFTKDFLTFAVGIAGGLAFLMMLLGAFQMLTSAGNPETLQAGRERFTNAIIGLMIIIFAVLLLQIIGFGILGIPGFGE